MSSLLVSSKEILSFLFFVYVMLIDRRYNVANEDVTSYRRKRHRTLIFLRYSVSSGEESIGRKYIFVLNSYLSLAYRNMSVLV